MKAAVARRYGPPSVVEIAEVPRPIPGPKDVLIKVRATTVTAGDWRLRSGIVPRGFGLFMRLSMGISRPRNPILGWECAGEVASVGPAVTRFAPGDKVFGARIGSCHAEYAALPEDTVAPMPTNLSFGEAAALTYGGCTALTFLRDKARIRPGERVLINGASGAVGSAAVQLARHFGGPEGRITGVCSAANAALVTTLGADQVIDYTVHDFAAGNEQYDVILDAVGNCSFDRCKGVLAPGGRLLLVLASLGALIAALVRPSRGSRRVLGGMSSVRGPNLEFLKGLAETGAFKPVIDRTYPFDRIADAHAYVDTGRKRGNVVITVV